MRIVVLVAGITPDVALAAETTVIAELTALGFDVRDAELVSGADASVAAGQLSGLIALGRAAGAATVLVMEVTADARPIVAGMYSGTAAVTVKTYGTANGTIIGTDRVEIGSARSRAEPGPTPAAAASSAAAVGAYQAVRAAARRIESARR
jgi:hypothetical protein